jgi:hypothetical protein
MADLRPAWLALNHDGYLTRLRAMAKMCAAFWWHSPDVGIMHSGTVCFVDTRERVLGITADHVYRQYLKDRERDQEFICQFGNLTIRPERRVIDRNSKHDLVTFDLPELAGGDRTYRPPVGTSWPAKRLVEGNWTLHGGYPAKLRATTETTAEFDFESIFAQVHQVTPRNVIMEVDYADMFWPDAPEGREVNTDPAGKSGGPVYWVDETQEMTYLTLVGFIIEYHENYSTMLARHADLIRPDGSIVA